MRILNNIRKTRIGKEISHEAMAMNLGISQTAYTKLERGDTKLTVERLFKIADILEVTVAELLESESSVQQNIHNNEKVTAIGNQRIENLHQENKEIYEKLIQAKEEQIVLLKSLLER